MDADELEQVVGPIHISELAEFLRIQLDIDDAQQASGLIDDGESEKAVLDKELAGVENGRLRRQGDYLTEHDVGERSLRRTEEQAARRHDALQMVILVNDVKVDDAALGRV